jgi:hypothetical protein
MKSPGEIPEGLESFDSNKPSGIPNFRDKRYEQTVPNGEFDHGSGRTLAACLRHASRARPSGLAANGGVIHKQPALKTGIAPRKRD